MEKEKQAKVIGVIGSRSLSHNKSTLVGAVTEDLLNRSFHIATGGAVGADEYCLNHLVHIGLADHGTLYSPWKDYSGFPVKVRALTRQFREYKGSIIWGNSSGKEEYSIVRTALLQRNLRLVEAVDGIVAFLQGKSNGTVFTLRKAVQAHLPVVVFAFETTLPSFNVVKWKALKCGGCWEGAFKAVYTK